MTREVLDAFGCAESGGGFVDSLPMEPSLGASGGGRVDASSTGWLNAMSGGGRVEAGSISESGGGFSERGLAFLPTVDESGGGFTDLGCMAPTPKPGREIQAIGIMPTRVSGEFGGIGSAARAESTS